MDKYDILILFLVVIIVAVLVIGGIMTAIKSSFKAVPAPKSVLSDTQKRDQAYRMKDIRRRQKDLMRQQRQKIRDSRR